jgi:hypothetical protein
MSDQLNIPPGAYPALPPVAVNDDAMERFNREMDRRLTEFDILFFEPRRHPTISVRRHRAQPPRKPR